MYPEPTELLWIGCLAELIWIPRFRSGTWTPITSSQTLTRSIFTRDECNNLLHLFNISNFSSIRFAQNSSLISCAKRWRRGFLNRNIKKTLWQNPDLQRRIGLVPESFSSSKNLITTSDPVKLEAAGTRACRTRRNSKPNEAPSSSEAERYQPWRFNGGQRVECFEQLIERLKIDQESDRDHWCLNDWLWRLHMEYDKLVVWLNSSDHECQNLRLRRLGAVWEERRYKREPEGSLEREN